MRRFATPAGNTQWRMGREASGVAGAPRRRPPEDDIYSSTGEATGRENPCFTIHVKDRVRRSREILDGILDRAEGSSSRHAPLSTRAPPCWSLSRRLSTSVSRRAPRRGIADLYSHQARVGTCREGRHAVVVTQTASGKSSDKAV